ncbi:DUF397 domain-containing protein [Streptomyces carminius]|uniref:DUF397 domain-containing protein n=1 Tax=Streptomyces carminius TaxID=2665496 RepID=A0A2M8LY75_9ACTN|nr:DUF397 domain-containing protein [Streptomyces carminius]PJE96926.1 DUF397 domain-containing protein [Streptomyces carminius]
MTDTPDLGNVQWRKASVSESTNGCLEVAFLPGDRVALRDNEDPDNPPFVVTRHVWECFIDGAKGNEFDIPA